MPTHLTEDHQDAIGALRTTLDTLSTDFLAFQQDSWNISMEMLRVMGTIAHDLKRGNDLKEEEMGKQKGKGKERAQEEEPRRGCSEGSNGNTEMGGAGPLSLV
ncbi:hypothetical protein ID866_9103 [Astraeus odoratus]|nr:hypothetical protein ID866_9103 [Astraeus odoratus]